jgi:hypothetical protein
MSRKQNNLTFRYDNEMMSRLRNALSRIRKPSRTGLCFNRPLVLFQSDDWGRAGIRDREGWEELRAAGLNLGQKPYDFYSLETADDLHALADSLQKHRDSVGQTPSIVMNFILANVDFDRALDPDQKQIPLRSLTEGLPGKWNRPQLFEAYSRGVQERVFYPALHGLTHFCGASLARGLKSDGERSGLLHKLWAADTPYIYWRMPWIGYEYWDPELRPANRFLQPEEQHTAINRAAAIFRELFNSTPFSACAPGYRANVDTRRAWFENGIRVAQNGPSELGRPYLDESEMLFSFRTVEIEGAIQPCELGQLMTRASECFARGLPVVISIHSINFHSTLKDFRTPTLRLLNEFLTALKTRWPHLLYVNDAELFSIATQGSYSAESGKVAVTVTGAKN